MSTRKRRPHPPLYHEKLPIMYITTIALAALAIVMHEDSPVVWTFLGVAIGHLLGKGVR